MKSEFFLIQESGLSLAVGLTGMNVLVNDISQPHISPDVCSVLKWQQVADKVAARTETLLFSIVSEAKFSIRVVMRLFHYLFFLVSPYI